MLADAANLANAANLIADNLQEGVRQKGSASLVVSGGSSPLPIFAALRSMDLPWADITISLVDDRLVSDDDDASNVKLLKSQLLIEVASDASFISLKDMNGEAEQLSRPFDVMLLGMGTDGHFASLFPNMPDPDLAFSLEQPAQILTTPPRGNPLVPRVSMNLSMILDSQNLYLMVSGAEKQSVFAQAEHDQDLPIHHLLKQTKTKLQILKG